MATLTHFGMGTSSLLTVGGNAITVIAINYWLREFPPSASPQLAMQFVSSAMYWVLFVLLTLALCFKFSPQVVWSAIVGPWSGPRRWRRILPRFWLAFVCGLTDILSSILNLYATPHTPEVLQALLQVTIAFFALITSLVFLPEERAKKHAHPLLIASFVALGVGLAVASRGPIVAASRLDGSLSQIAWITIYVLGCASYGAWSVAQRMYLDRVASDHKPSHSGEEGAAIQEGCQERDSLLLWGNDDVPNCDVPDVVHKVIMLLGDTTFQLILCIVLLPIDIIPWFGNSTSMQGTWHGFSSGVADVFSSPKNFTYGLLYSIGYVMTYLGEGYLNHYSPTLASIVLQMSAPVTAVLLIAVPQWNINQQGETPLWWCQAIAIVVLLAATVLYQRWEMTQRSS